MKQVEQGLRSTVCGRSQGKVCGVRRALQQSCPLPALPRSAGERTKSCLLPVLRSATERTKRCPLPALPRDAGEGFKRKTWGLCLARAHDQKSSSANGSSSSGHRSPPLQCGGGLGRGQSRLSAIRYPLSASRSSGMSLVAALFLIVVIAALGAFAVRIGMGQQQTVNLSLLGNRAMAAANAGIEWSAYRALEDGNCSNGSLSLTQGALTGFTVDVTCVSTSFGSEGTLYVIEAASRSGTYGRADYVSRRIRARFFE
jgi:MSHA biogenesis protein MshP